MSTSQEPPVADDIAMETIELPSDGELITTDFKKGDRVVYTPTMGPEKECGVVSSVNDTWVFVKYDNAQKIMRTGDEDYTAQATDPDDLRNIES